MTMTIVPRKRNRAGWDEGAVMVEAAITLSVFLMLLFGIIQFAIAYWQWNTMLLAAGQAGRFVMINKATCDTACAEAQMQAILPAATVCAGAPAPGEMCVTAANGGGNPPTMTLTAQYNFNLVAMLPGPFMITSSITVPLI